MRWSVGSLSVGQEDICQRLQVVSVIARSWTPKVLTSRTSNGFRFLAVRGVLPRSLPGVLKISVTFLFGVSKPKKSYKQSFVHLIFAENLRHMLVEPFHLIAGRESKVFCFLSTEPGDLIILVIDPLLRSYLLRSRADCCHDGFGVKRGKEREGPLSY